MADKVVPLRPRIEAEPVLLAERLRLNQEARETTRLKMVALGHALSIEYLALICLGVDEEAARRLLHEVVSHPEYTGHFRVEVVPIEPPAGRGGE